MTVWISIRVPMRISIRVAIAVSVSGSISVLGVSVTVSTAGQIDSLTDCQHRCERGLEEKNTIEIRH